MKVLKRTNGLKKVLKAAKENKIEVTYMRYNLE